MHNIKRSILILATMGMVAGCAGTETADDSELAGFTEEAQTFGGPGFPLPASLRVDPGDTVETYGPETVACSEMGVAKAALTAECKEDGGVHYGVLYRYNSADGDCSVAVRCLFNASND
jgi:hypothetical protein